jgi:hypothetical protein
MSNRYATPEAFRRALEDRLRAAAAERGQPLNDLRLKVVIERLLARLFAAPDPPWLLKGGYAMELRYRPRARTTRDVDLAIATDALAGELAGLLAQVREELQAAVSTDPGDFFEFRIGTPRGDVAGAPLGGGRFPIEARLAGREYARFHLDVGFGDAVIGAAERLVGEDHLAFAGVTPGIALAISRAQQLAEKAHAYTFPWDDRTNTRTKDLVDMILLIERGALDPGESTAALRATFDTRGTHALPPELPRPPAVWQDDFAALATEVGLSTTDLAVAFERVAAFWRGMLKETSGAGSAD